MNRTNILGDMTSWTDKQLELLCKPENHKITFDGCEYRWYHKIDGNKWDLHSIYAFKEWKKPYGWLKWALGSWAKELEARRKDAAKEHFKDMQSYLYKIEQAKVIASNDKLKTKEKIKAVKELLPEESVTFIATLLNLSRQAIHKHL